MTSERKTAHVMQSGIMLPPAEIFEATSQLKTRLKELEAGDFDFIANLVRGPAPDAIVADNIKKMLKAQMPPFDAVVIDLEFSTNPYYADLLQLIVDAVAESSSPSSRIIFATTNEQIYNGLMRAFPDHK